MLWHVSAMHGMVHERMADGLVQAMVVRGMQNMASILSDIHVTDYAWPATKTCYVVHLSLAPQACRPADISLSRCCMPCSCGLINFVVHTMCVKGVRRWIKQGPPLLGQAVLFQQFFAGHHKLCLGLLPGSAVLATLSAHH